MAISSLSKSSIRTFDKFNRTSVGNVSAEGLFAFADATSTFRTSPDGSTWTSRTTPGSVTQQYLTYHGSTLGWQWWNGGANYIPSFTKDLLTGKLDGDYNNQSNNNTPTNNGWFQTAAGANLYWGINTQSRIQDQSAKLRQYYGSAPYATAMCRPAWDGASTWAVLSDNNTTQWARFTTQGTSGSGIMPVEFDGAGKLGWSNWAFYTPPAANYFRDIIFWQGYWFVEDYSGVIYRTANIATASPTWTTMSTLSNVNSPMFIANNELWVLSGGYNAATAYKLTTPLGTWASISMPASKQSNNIVYGNGTYVIFNGDGTVFRSTTGATGSFSSVNTGSTASYASRLTGGFGPSNG